MLFLCFFLDVPRQLESCATYPHLDFFSIFCQQLLNVTLCSFMEETAWHNITDEDTDRLLNAIEHQDKVLQKLIVFRSGLIPKEMRWLQLKAHEFYDLLSKRELQVFKLRVRSHTFPEIASVVGVTESSCKEYWRRTIKKINAVIGLPNSDG